MRQLHQLSGSRGLTLSFVVSVVATAAIFVFIPFASTVAKPTRTLELRKVSLSDLPPPTEDEPPLPSAQEEESVPETIAPLQLEETPQQINLNPTLEVASGFGGALAGFGEVKLPVVVEKATQEAFAVAELDEKPEPVSQVPPIYPPELRKAKIEGRVTLVFVLTEDGHVEDVRVENSTRPEFERPAVEAIRKWRFRPGTRAGKAVSAYVRISMRFKIGSE